MRFLPKVKIMQEHLDLNIININKAIDKLIRENFTGYVKFLFQEDYEALMLLDKGAIYDQLFFSPEKMLKNKEAKEEISEYLTKGEGEMDIIELNDKAFDCFLSLFYGSNYFGTLQSSYLDFQKFLKKIQNEKLKGCLALSNDENDVILYFVGGSPSSIYFRGQFIRKGTKKEVMDFVAANSVTIDFFTAVQATDGASGSRKEVPEGEKETLHLIKVPEGSQNWFEDQYGNRYKKDQIKDLWEKYNIIL